MLADSGIDNRSGRPNVRETLISLERNQQSELQETRKISCTADENREEKMFLRSEPETDRAPAMAGIEEKLAGSKPL